MAITKQLSLGMTDPQVRELQQFLNANGYAIAQSGPGAPGNETDFFGPMTQLALRKYQSDKGIVSTGNAETTGYGRVGPLTIQALSGVPTSQTQNNLPSPTGDQTSSDPGSPIHASKTKDDHNYDSTSLDSIIQGQGTGYSDADRRVQDIIQANVPGGATGVLSPMLPQYGTPEWDSAVNQIEAAAYDYANMQSNAQTEQEVALANYNWEKTKDIAMKTLGLNLSNNAMAAWDQVQGYKNQYSGQGLSGSGLENETIDNYLKRRRIADQQSRQQTADSTISGDQTFYTQHATPQQIQALIDEDKAKGLAKGQWRATQWGLVPSDEAASDFDAKTLKQKFPNATDEEINNFRNAMVDENGNYRSDVYSKLTQNKIKNLDSKKTFQQSTMQSLSDMASQQAEKNYDSSIDPYVRPAGTAATPDTKIPSTTPSKTPNLTPPPSMTQASTAAGNLGTNSTTKLTTQDPNKPLTVGGMTPTQLEASRKQAMKVYTDKGQAVPTALSNYSWI